MDDRLDMIQNNRIKVENECRYKQYSREFPLPDFESAFPYKPNPFFENAMQRKKWMQWMYESSLMSPNSFKKIQGVGDHCAYFYPFCEDISRYECLFKQFGLLFICDDQCEKEFTQSTLLGSKGRRLRSKLTVPEQIEQMFDKLTNDKSIPMLNWKPYVMAWYSAFEPIYKTFNETQKRRFINVWKDYVQGLKEERSLIKDTYQINSYEDLIKLRNKSGAVRAEIQIIEYCDNIFVPEYVWESKNWQKLMDLASKNVCFVNDIFSFEKEFKQNDRNLKTMSNLVAFHAFLEDCSIGEAMKKSVKIIRDNEKHIFKTKAKVLKEFKCEENVKEFLKRLDFYIGGNYKAHTFMDRYNKDLT